MKQLLPQFSDWTIDSTREDGQDYVKYTTKSGRVHEAGLLGDGVICLFRIVAVLSKTSNEKILLCDEPELSLHTEAQKKLASEFARMSAQKQIIVTTHSPYFIRWGDLKKGASLIRLQKPNDTNCQVFALQSTANYERVLSLTNDWQKPHLLDAVARELFFTNNVVFLEGQEDMGLISRFITDESLGVNFDVFGYGSGGAGNIEHFLQMAKDLGLNAGALFDGDKTTEKQKCEALYPDFCIKQLTTADVRDSYKRDDRGRETNDLEKEGIFDRKGRIKSAHRADLLAIINDFVTHFKK